LANLHITDLSFDNASKFYRDLRAELLTQRLIIDLMLHKGNMDFWFIF